MAKNLWKDIAFEKGLTFQDRAVFGWLNGCYITLTMVWDVLHFHVYLPCGTADDDPASQEEKQRQNALLRAEAVRALENTVAEFKLTRVRSFSGDQSANVEFRGTLKKMKRLGDFLESATARVAALGIAAGKTCSYCHKAIEYGEVPVKIKENIFPMHDSCADEAERQAVWTPEPQKGSLPMGILGAALAAVIGAIPWAAVLAMGYITSIVGILIGFLVSKGYDLLHGRQGRVKIAVVLFFVVLSVALGQVAGDSYYASKYYDEAKAGLKSYQTMMYTKAEALAIYWTEDLWASPEAMKATFSNFGMGVFFALLGSFGMFRQLARETAPQKPRRITSAL